MQSGVCARPKSPRIGRTALSAADGTSSDGEARGGSGDSLDKLLAESVDSALGVLGTIVRDSVLSFVESKYSISKE